MHIMLLARNTSRDTHALTVFFHSITDSNRERERGEVAFSVYQNIILHNTECLYGLVVTYPCGPRPPN